MPSALRAIARLNAWKKVNLRASSDREQVLERNLTTSFTTLKAKRAFDAIINHGLSVLFALLIIVVSISTAAFLKLESSQTAVTRYVSAWEEEIARNLLLNRNRELFEKVRLQISDLSPEIRETLGSAAAEDSPPATGLARTQACEENELTQSLMITLYGTPAGALTICRSPLHLGLEALRSPVFLLGLLLGGLILIWHTRRKSAERASLAAAHAIDQLSRQVAHDLRSPLGALKIVGTRMQATPTSSGDAEAMLAVLRSSIQRISKITDDLLSADARAKAEGHSGSIGITTVVQSVVQEMKISADGSGVQIEYFEIPGNESHLSSDSGSELARVVSNLIQNAIEATRDATRGAPCAPAVPVKKEVKIWTRPVKAGIEIEVADNGNGIPPSSWRSFGRRGFTIGKPKGNGLGVWHAREWTNSVGGKLRVRSSRRNGTSIVLTLPR